MGTIIPTTPKAQIGTRHQFVWNDTAPEIGAFCFNTGFPFPGPPELQGPGIVVHGRGYDDSSVVNVTIPPGPGVTFDLFRGSDSTTGTVTFAPGVYSVDMIVAGINGTIPAWSAPNFAYASDIGGGGLVLVDKKPLIGDASIEVRLSLVSTAVREAAALFTGFSYGDRSTANTAKTIQFVMDAQFTGSLYKGDVSDEFLIPANSDAVSILIRLSTRSGVRPQMLLFWSDGSAPFDGATPSLILPVTTMVPPVLTIFDFGLQEFELVPTKDPNTGAYPLEGSSLFKVDPFGGMPGYRIDPAPPHEISEFWVNTTVTVVPPPGMTRLRIGFTGSYIDPLIYPMAPPGVLSRVQAYAWASRKGTI